MYEAYWKLSCRPFQNIPDPTFFYRSPQHEDALARLAYAVNEGMGAALLTGDYGCGKTFLVQVLFSRLGPGVLPVSCMAQPTMTLLDLLRLMTRSVTGQNLALNRSDLLPDALVEALHRRLIENDRDGRHTLLVLDEAHLLVPDTILEATRLLLNYEGPGGFLLTLLLVGPPELAEHVQHLKPLAQRIPISARLCPLARSELEPYITSRLAQAGCQEPLFTPDAIAAIAEYSGGIPRRINTLCDVSLALACVQRAEQVDAARVRAAVERFGVL